MNLHSRKARIPIAALGVTALCTAGLGVMSTSAFAVGEDLTILGADSNAASIVAVDPTGSTATAGVTYGVKVGGTNNTGSTPLAVQVLTAPTSGALRVETVAGNAAPVGSATATTTGTTSAATSTSSPTLTFASGTAPAASAGDVVTNAGGATIGIVASTTSTTTITLAANAAVAVGSGDVVTVTRRGGFLSVPVSTGSGIPLSYATGDNIYLGSTVPGTYTLRLFRDTALDGAYQANADDSTPTFTLTVKSAADAFSLSAPSSVEGGATGAMATVASSVSGTDIRGGSPAALSTSLAALLRVGVTDNGSNATGTINTAAAAAATSLVFTATPSFSSGDHLYNAANQDVGIVTTTATTSTVAIAGGTNFAVASGDVLHTTGTGVTGDSLGGAAAFDSTNGFYRYLATSSSTPLTQGVGTPHTLASALSFNGGVSLGNRTTEVTSNGVVTVTLAAKTGQTANVAGTGTSTKLRTGTSTVTYTATAVDGASTPVPQAGKTVVFTLTPGSGITLADLSANGTAVPTTGASAGKVSVTTDTNGVATLAVTSAKSADGNIYSVAAMSGTATASPAITATYTAPTAAGTPIKVTSTPAELTPTTGTGVVIPLKGTLLDQYGEPFQPPNTAPQTVTVAVNGTTVCQAVVTGGSFSCNYTTSSTVAPAAGSTLPFTFNYNGVATGSGTIRFASTMAAAKVNLITPNDAATGINLQGGTAPSSTQQTGATDFGSSTGEVKGTVLDSTGAGLAYKTVTITSSGGVYFSTVASGSLTTTSDDDFKDSITVVTDASGQFSGAFAYFTKSGDVTITATSGTAVDTAKVTTDAATQPWKVTANDISGNPGSTLIATGTVVDAFGNPAAGAQVSLSLGTSTLGSLGTTLPVTNSAGVWSTTFTSGSNTSGTADLVATLTNGSGTPLTTNPVAGTTYLTNAGITIPHGEYTDQAKITLSSQEVTISTTGSLVGGGKAQISGKAAANSSVEIYSKPSGDAGFSLVGTRPVDADGTWGVGTTLTKTTAFFVKNGATVSPTVATVVYSYETLKAKALGKGKVEFKVYGVPNVKGIVNVYYGSKRIGHVASDSHGDATVVVQSSKGKRTFTVYFVAPGTSLKGKALTGTVK